jgi:hypothetical protein
MIKYFKKRSTRDFYHLAFVSSLILTSAFFFYIHMNTALLPKANQSANKVNQQEFYLVNNRKNFHKSEKVNVVFWNVKPEAGYGNRIYSVLSAFLVAMLTNSFLLIHWKEIEKYVESPFNMTFANFTDNSDLDANKKEPPIFALNVNTANTWKANKTLLLNATIPINHSRYSVFGDSAYFFDLCSNPLYFEKLSEHKMVKKETIKRALLTLSDASISKNEKLENLFQIGFEYAGSVLNKHWRLKRNLTDRIERFAERNFRNKFVIGLQIRSDYIKTSEEIDVFVKCAKDIEKRHLNESAGLDKTSVKWYVSADNESLIQFFREKFPNRILSGVGKIEHISNDPVGYERAFFDIELLTKCNETILTGGSTFGFVASLKSQKRPFFVNGGVRFLKKECQILSFANPSVTPKGDAFF